MTEVGETASAAALLLGTVAAVHGVVVARWRWPGAALLLAGIAAWAAGGEDESPVLLTLREGTGVHLGDLALLPAVLLLAALVRRR